MLRKVVLLLFTILSLQAQGLSFEFLPSQSGPEKEFRQLMEGGNFRQALMVWSTSHRNSKFGQSQTGIATWAYVLQQNGLPLKALETLIFETQPKAIDSRLLSLWTTELKNSPYIQKGWIPTVGGWKKIVDNSPVTLKIKKKKDVTLAFNKADALPNDAVNQKTRIWWQIATLAPQINEVDSAVKALKLIRESGQSIMHTDQVEMALARVLYQKGDLEASLEIYKKIPKGSLFWMDAIEEKAWAHLRQNDFDKALGDVTTALSPALVLFAGPESYFLSNLMSLKVCDYPRIFNTSEAFKKRHRNRLVALQEISTSGTHKGLVQALEKMESKGPNVEAAGSNLEFLPRAVFHDRKFVQAVELRRELLAEAKKAAELSENAKALGDNQDLERIALDARAATAKLQKTAFERARVLAGQELVQYKKIMNKMHIIEGEVIQRLAVDESLKGKRTKREKVKDSGDVLVFPYDSEEVWMDELDNYKAQVKECPTLQVGATE